MQDFCTEHQCSDPLPFKSLSLEKHRRGVTFVDVDYPELMFRKKGVILQHREMEDLISPLRTDTADPAVLLWSDRYVAVGCDLRDTAKLRGILDSIFDLASCLVLCVAEVSLTYMDVGAADSLVRWAAQYEEGKKYLCVLQGLVGLIG